MHAEAYAWARRTLGTLEPQPTRVVEFGGRNINGSIRAAFSGAAYLSVDLVDGPGVDVLADAASYQPDQPPDLVICMEVLEHAPNAEALLRNAHHILAWGGHLLVTAASQPRPAHSGVDGGTVRPGEFYRNVSSDQLRAWLSDFEVLALDQHPRGDIYALARKTSA